MYYDPCTLRGLQMRLINPEQERIAQLNRGLFALQQRPPAHPIVGVITVVAIWSAATGLVVGWFLGQLFPA